MLKSNQHKQIFRTGIAACASLMMTTAFGADNSAWTNKPVRVIVPAVAGGTMDIVSRVLADQLSKDIGASFFVDNKRGAGGNVAVSSLLSSPADGQTIMIAFDNILTEIPHVIKQNFSLSKDIKPIAAFARSGFVLVSGGNLPATDFKGFVSYLKANPKKDTFASYAVGSASHYAGLMFSEQIGLKLQHVPFVGSPPALLQVMSGEVPFMVDGVVTSLPLIRAGKLKAYAVISQHRLPQLPSVPTFAELGFPNIQFSNQAVVIVQAAMSAEMTEKIRLAVYKAAAAASVQKHLADLGLESMPSQSSEAVAKQEKDGFDRIGKIIRDYKLDVNQ